MAINPTTLFQNLNGPDTAYPYGSAKNSSGLGLKDGSEIKAQVFNDIWGFLQRVLSEASVVPSGIPDTVLVSQYYDALMGLVQDAIQAEVAGMTGEWVDITPGAGWAELDSVNHPFQYRVVMGGAAIQFRGTLAGNGTTTTILAAGGLPAGARPSTGTMELPIATSSAAAQYMEIHSDGSITALSNSITFACNCTAPLW